MQFLADLWLPIVLAAVLVFIVSSILHVALPIHRNDYAKLPGEDDVLAGMRATGVKPGAYMFPCAASMKDAATPEMIRRYEQGPVGFMTVLPNGPIKMGKSLVLWFLYSVLISIIVAYVTTLAVPAGSSYLGVFRVAGAVAVTAYAVPYLAESIWKAQSWVTTGKFVFDGVAYALVTAGVFGWLWPDAA